MAKSSQIREIFFQIRTEKLGKLSSAFAFSISPQPKLERVFLSFTEAIIQYRILRNFVTINFGTYGSKRDLFINSQKTSLVKGFTISVGYINL
jgi:hypothetical protein